MYGSRNETKIKRVVSHGNPVFPVDLEWDWTVADFTPFGLDKTQIEQGAVPGLKKVTEGNATYLSFSGLDAPAEMKVVSEGVFKVTDTTVTRGNLTLKFLGAPPSPESTNLRPSFLGAYTDVREEAFGAVVKVPYVCRFDVKAR